MHKHLLSIAGTVAAGIAILLLPAFFLFSLNDGSGKAQLSADAPVNSGALPAQPVQPPLPELATGDASSAAAQPVCGNGVLEYGEQCDDGNANNGDGCSDVCQWEPGYQCMGQPSVCVHTSSASSQSPVSSASDASSVSSSAPSSSSASSLSSSSSVSSSSVSSSSSSQAAGKAASASASSTAASHAASSTYRYFPRDWTKVKADQASQASQSSAIQRTLDRCGNGFVEPKDGETCDDGNTNNGDGCDAACHIEKGYSCHGQPSQCEILCGDGVVGGSETCDDGNTTDGDGCSSSCHLEMGWNCSGSPSVCKQLTPP